MVWYLIFLMCIAVQATIKCPEKCNCRENQVACPRGLPSPEDIPQETKTLILGPQKEDYALFLSAISISQLIHLSISSCQIQGFDNITFDQFTNLQTLDLSSNLITQLSEETSAFNNTQLKVFDLSQNLIQTINGAPFRTLSSLEVLNLSGNAISIISDGSFMGLNALVSLDLSKNNITELKDKTFDSLNNLQQLNLSKNRLITLSENCFSNLQRLQQLDLSWNKLSYVSPTTLQALPSLSRLMIAGNLALGGGTKDSALLVGTGKRLQTLDASKTGLEHVPAALTHSVRTLRLAGNSIKFVECGDLDSYPLLQLLDLTSNLIEEIEEDSLGRLEMLVILYLTDNNLQAIPRSLPDSLKILHLEFNHIEQIVSGDLLGLPKLEVLLLNDNEIKVVQEGAFSQMGSLITLDLSRNPISILPSGTLAGPISLQVLRLSSLSVTPLEEDGSFPIPSPEHLIRLDLSNSPGLARQLLADKAVLSAFRELQELNLTNNDLVYIRNDLLHFIPQLRDLHVTGNRLNCSGLLWLSLWMRVQDQPEHREVICFSPPELYGTPLIDLQDNNMETTLLTTIKPTTTTSIFNITTGYQVTSDTKDILNVTTENQVHEGIEKPDIVAVESDGHISKTNLTTDRPTSQASNYISNSPTTIAPNTTTIKNVENSTQNHKSNEVSKEINTSNKTIEGNRHKDNSEKEKIDWNTGINSTKFETTTKTELQNETTTVLSVANNVTDKAMIPNDELKLETDNATAQMSMYSSRRDSERNYSEDANIFPVHPGMFILIGAILGTLLVFLTLISHVRKKRKRFLGEEVSDIYSRQQENIEVNSLPIGFSELW